MQLSSRRPSLSALRSSHPAAGSTATQSCGAQAARLTPGHWFSAVRAGGGGLQEGVLRDNVRIQLRCPVRGERRVPVFRLGRSLDSDAPVDALSHFSPFLSSVPGLRILPSGPESICDPRVPTPLIHRYTFNPLLPAFHAGTLEGPGLGFSIIMEVTAWCLSIKKKSLHGFYPVAEYDISYLLRKGLCNTVSV